MDNFKLIKKEELSDIKSVGYIYEHRTGAKLVFIANDDEDSVFHCL
jgi:Zn-dependent M16 (insulinase) family peptidase